MSIYLHRSPPPCIWTIVRALLDWLQTHVLSIFRDIYLELMFSSMSLLRSAQQRHLSHTFLVKLKLFNSLTFPSPVFPFFQFVVPGHFMTCNTPGFSRMITN